MFTTLSRRTTLLAASSFAMAAAATFATVHDTGDRPGTTIETGNSAAKDPYVDIPGREVPEVQPRPGEVAACDQPGENEIVRVRDRSAPNGQRPVWIRRPPGPDDHGVPVLYLLHGSTGTHRDIVEAGVGPIMDEAMCRHGVEFVVAAPYGQETGRRDTEWGDAVHGEFNIETFVTQTAIDVVEGDQRRPRELRAIGGFSMGGYGSAALSLRNPGIYSQVVSWGGYFKVDDPSDTFGPDPDDAHAPDQLLDNPGVADIRFNLIEGTDDRTPLQTGSIHGEAERFAELLREHDMTVKTRFPEGGHDFDTWNPTIPKAVDFLVEGWAQAEDED
ncbi:alpha/beta hydrolase [Halostreptopolyspora alba]|uniref:Esterase n=1 Tax=Halostreptopolyspora alba TaxID=2487137 RepID=A0A3N0E859_9ACTN|nr:esterase [Nocardiopsaceae bacterium YIM 96095]